MTDPLKIVDLKASRPRPGTVDLRRDNRIGDLLDEYEYAARVLNEATKTKNRLTEEIKQKLGDAKQGLVEGWLLKRSSWVRKEYVVKAGVVDRLTVTRKPKLMSEKAWARRISDDLSHGGEDE